MAETPRPDINLSQIKIGGTIGGLIFAIGSMAIFLVGVPGLWYFLVGAIGLGAGFATIFYLIRRAAAKHESRNTIHVV